MLRIASFDIGKRNFAHYIEDRDFKELLKMKGKQIKNDFLKGGKTIELDVVNLCEKKNRYNDSIRRNMIQYLDSKYEIFSTVDIFVIEQQFFSSFGRKKTAQANVDAIKIGECVSTYFTLNFPDAEVVTFSSTFKTQSLNAPKKMNKIQRKKWAVDKAKEIFRSRGETDMCNIYDYIEDNFKKRCDPIKIQAQLKTISDGYQEFAKKVLVGKQKLDDISDSMLQCQAYLMSILK